MSQAITEDTVGRGVQVEEQERIGTDEFQALWDAYAQDGFGDIHKMRCFRKMDKILTGLFVRQPGARVLDAGCGDGALFKAILRNINPSVIVGADLSETMLARALDGVRRYKLRQAIIQLEQRDLGQPFPWPASHFDAAVSHMFSCFVPLSWREIQGELYRVVRTDGYLYLTTFLAGWDFSQIVKKHTLEEALRPVGLYHGLRLKKHPRHITEVAKEVGLTYPLKEEIVAFYQNLGASEVLTEKIFWGAGIALRVHK